jgi:alkylresorcinol/alkylpyrone synthase
MFLSGLGRATPPKRYTQLQCWDALEASGCLERLNARSHAILRKVLRGSNGICSRFLAFDDLSEAFALAPDTLDGRFARYAPVVASQAAGAALDDASVAAREIDAVVVSTCTGYLCPGLTSYVSDLVGLRTDILNLDLVGQGCGAAIPNMRAA